MTRPNQFCYSFLVKGCLLAAQRYGVTRTGLLKGTGLSDVIFDDPYQLMTYNQEFQIHQNFISLTGVAEAGLLAGLHSPLSSLGAPTRLHQATTDIPGILKRSKKYEAILKSHLKWTNRIKDNHLIHIIEDYKPLGDLRQYFTERLCAILYVHAKELLENPPQPILLKLPFAKPSYDQLLTDTFNCPIEYNQQRAELHFTLDHLNASLPTHDPVVETALLELCDSLLLNLQNHQNIITEVSSLLTEKPGYFPSLENIAERMKLSSRTLRRQLNNEDTTYQALLNDVRRKIAEKELKFSETSIQDVANLCGFSDGQNFSQAFRRWTGKTPSQYRADT